MYLLTKKFIIYIKKIYILETKNKINKLLKAKLI